MSSQEITKSKGERSRSADAAKGVEKPALVAEAVGAAHEAPPNPLSSSQPWPRNKGAKQGGKSRRPSRVVSKSHTAPAAEKGPPTAQSTQEPPTAASTAHPAASTAVPTAQAVTSLGQKSSMHRSSVAPPDPTAAVAKESGQLELPHDASASAPRVASEHHKTSTCCASKSPSQGSAASKASSQRAKDDSTKEAGEAIPQEPPPDTSASSPTRARQHHRTSTTRTLPALPQRSTAEESMKALSDLLNAGMDAPFSTEHTLSPKEVTKKNCKASVVALVFVITLLAGILVAFTIFLFSSPLPRTGLLCTTRACAQHRDLIESLLNKSADPCDDFVAYVCGRWRPRKEFAHQSLSTLTDMVMAWQTELPDTLLKGAARFPTGRKPAAMFNSCMTQTGSQVDVFKSFMSQHGLSWPEDPVDNDPGPLEVLFDLAFNWNVNLWFSLKLLHLAEGDRQNKRRLFFAPNNLMLEWRTIFRQIPRQNFDDVYSDIFKLFAKGADKSPPPERISEDYNRLQYIFDTFILSSMGKARVPAVLPLRELDSLTNLTNTTYVKYAIDSKLAIQPPFTMQDLMLMSDVARLNVVLKLFGEIDDIGVHRHLAWLFLQVYAPVANPETVLLILHGDKHRAEEARPLFCAGEVEASYKLLVAAMAAVTQFSQEEHRHVDALLAGIVEAAVEKASAAPWLNNGTEEAAAEKLRSVRSVLWPDEKFLTDKGLEEAYVNFPDQATSFADFWIKTRRSLRGLIGSDAGLQELQIGDSIAQPYVEYVHVLNQLSLSLGALAPPIYYKDGTKAMLHGGLGYVYAKELVGAVDTEGVKVDPLGNIVSSWLSEDVKPIFQDRVLGCLAGSSASVFPEVPAMEVAFAAFKQNRKDHDVQLSEELTEEKVFFITACICSCSKNAADNLYGGDCNKAVANFAPFAEAFQCRPGSRMNDIRKCTFFD